MADPFPKDPEGAVVALVLAGGTGGRLMPLTAARAKPMVPLAGQYRLIDVVLSNLAHSRLRDVWVVEQYRPFTLNQHLAGGRPWDLDGTRHGLRLLPPAQGRAEEGFARGNGHAIAQQLPLLEQFGAETVVVLSAAGGGDRPVDALVGAAPAQVSSECLGDRVADGHGTAIDRAEHHDLPRRAAQRVQRQ